MSAPLLLTLLYTHGLGGDFVRLPRLAVHLRALAQDQPAPLLLDLGGACSDRAWHCAATQGRSAFLALDALGYHAANAAALSAESRAKLVGQVSLGLVAPGQAWRYAVGGVRDEGLIVAHEATPALGLCIVCEPASQTACVDGVLRLQAPEPFSVGRLRLDWSRCIILEQAVYPLPDSVLPDTTVSALLELIEDEARAHQRRG
ncbi:MAG: hypothetical protein NZ750_04925 [Anaerolineae bacterium]|nr:hypothetical protein [Anaerolineae bacterium]MDW8173803.1 hypothetical protein [Anaerolineae bacterium]